jgi:hypothetical protein
MRPSMRSRSMSAWPQWRAYSSIMWTSTERWTAADLLAPGDCRETPSRICLAEHLVEFGVGPELPDLLRTAAGDGELGSPLQRLLA